METGINLSPLDSKLIWACVSSRFEKFLMCRLFVSCFFFLINIAPKLFSPFMAFDSADGAFSESLFPFKVIRRHNWDKIHFLCFRFSEDLTSLV